MHPRLLSSLILVEPVIVPDTFSGYGPLLSKLSLKRRDTWSSRSTAVKAARKTHKKWDKRVLERWALHGYRSLPTALYPENSHGDTNIIHDGPVTLTSTKHQEVMQYVRPNFGGHRPLGQEGPTAGPTHESLFQADIIGPLSKIAPFYRSEPVIAWKLLDHVRSSVLYLFGGSSPISKPQICAELLNRTGAGIGGSGGVLREQVKQQRIEGYGHQVPLEEVTQTAWAIAKWIGWATQRWQEDEVRVAKDWADRPLKDRLSVSAEWMPELEAACKVYEQKPRL
jgi:hypothetical protein